MGGGGRNQNSISLPETRQMSPQHSYPSNAGHLLTAGQREQRNSDGVPGKDGERPASE